MGRDFTPTKRDTNMRESLVKESFREWELLIMLMVVNLMVSLKTVRSMERVL